MHPVDTVRGYLVPFGPQELQHFFGQVGTGGEAAGSQPHQLPPPPLASAESQVVWISCLMKVIYHQYIVRQMCCITDELYHKCVVS